MQLAMRIFINHMPLPPLFAARMWVKRNTHGVGIPLNLISDIFSLPLRLFYISLSFALLLLLPHTRAQILCCNYYCIFCAGHGGNVAHFSSCILFNTFFSPSHRYYALHMFSLSHSLFLFASLPFASFHLPPSSSFLVSSRGSFLCELIPLVSVSFFLVSPVFPTSRRAFPLSNSRQFVVCRRSYYMSTSWLSHSHTIRLHVKPIISLEIREVV